MIRPAQLSDAPVVAGLWNSMIRGTLSTFTTVEKTTADMEALLAAREGAFFVAVEGLGCLGFVTFGSFRDGPGYAATVEHTVIVAPEGQGRGLGHQLLDTAEDAARSLGKHVMVAGISNTNHAAQRFHLRRGYVEVARMPEVGRKNGQWLDLVLMQKIL